LNALPAMSRRRGAAAIARVAIGRIALPAAVGMDAAADMEGEGLVFRLDEQAVLEADRPAAAAAGGRPFVAATLAAFATLVAA
jgi:hypothetical protein